MKLRHRSIFGSVILTLSIVQSASAATFYWDGTTGNWNDLTKWSTDLAGTTDPAAAPLATVSDTLNFNSTPGSSSNSIVYLNGNRGTSAILATLSFSGSGTTQFLGGIAGTGATNDLFVSGITLNSGSGAVTIGDTAASPTARVNVKAGSISFTNNSTSLLTFANGLNSFGSGGVTTFTFAGSGNTTMSGVIGNGTGTNSVAISKSGAGTLTLSGINTNTGATTVTGGTLTVTSTGVINNANTALTTGLSNSVSGGATLRIDGGTAKFNVGTSADNGLLLGTTTAGNAVVTNNGTLTITTGRMILGGSGAGSGTSTFTQDSGTTTVASNLYTGNFNASNLTISGGSFTVSGSSVISQRANTNFNISGTASVNFLATVTLGGVAGSYAPVFNLTGGTLSVVNIADSANGTSAVNFNGGTLRARADNADFLRADAVTIGNSGATFDTQAFNITVGQGLSRLAGATTDTLTKIGAGSLNLTGTNTYGGGSTVSAGTLKFANTAALPSTGAVSATGTGSLAINVGGAGEFTDATSGSGSVGGFFSGATFASGTAFGIDTTNAAGTVTYAGNFSGSGVGITKLGTGTLVLSGNNTNTGTVSINAGTLQAGSATALAGGAPLVMANAAATFDVNGNSFSFTNLSTGSASNTITNNGAGSGVDTLTITALTAPSGALFSDNGNRQLALNFTSSGAAVIAATTNALNTYSGGLVLGSNMRINPLAAASTVGSPGAISSGPFGRGTITLNGTTAGNGSQVYFNGANLTLVNDVIVNSNTGNGSRSGSFRISGTGAVISGNITANNLSAVFGADAAVTLSLTGKLTGNQGFTFNQSSGTSNFVATLNNASSNNDYRGTTTVGSTQTTLRLGASNQLPNGVNAGNLALTLGSFDLNGYNETINGLTGAGIIDNVANGAASASNTLTLGDNNATGTTFTGTIRNTTGSLSVVKTGTGSQSLQTGTNTFSGGLSIRNGSIIALNSTVLGGTGGNSGVVTLGDVSGSDSASLLIGSNSTTISNPIVLSTNATAGTYSIGISTGALSSAFAGGVTGANNLTLSNSGSGTLTIQTAAINNSGTVTNSGSGSGSAAIAIGFGSNVTDIIQNSTTSSLSISAGAASTNTGSAYIKAGTLAVSGPGGSTTITPLNNGIIYLGDTVGTSNATLAFGNTNTLPNAIVVQSNGNASVKAINVSGSGAPVYSGGITLNDDLDITTSSTSGLTVQTGDITINNNSTLAFKPSGTNAGTFTISSKITGAGGIVDFGGTTSGSPIFVLSGANDYTGTTTISKGTLRIGNTTTTGSLSPSSAIINNAAIVFNRTNAVLQGTDFANDISGTGSVSVASGGTYTFTANSFEGGMTLSGATTTQLNINHANALGSGTFTISGGDSGRIDNTSGSAVTLNNNAQTWSSNFTFLGTNDLNMGNGAVTMGGTRTLTVNAGNLTVGGAISGTGFGLTKRGAGTLILNGATTSSFTGVVTLGVTNGTDGFLVLGKDSALGTTAGGLVITGGTQTGGVKLTGGITISDSITFEGRASSTQGDFISNLSGSNIVQGVMTGGVQGNNYNIGSEAGLIDFQGRITTANTGRSLNLRGAGNGKISGVIENTGTGTMGVRLQGSGIWELSAANTHVGNTSIAGAGTIKLTNNLALQNSALDTLYAGGGTVDFSAVDTPTLGGLTNSGNLAMESNVTSLTLNLGSSATQTYTGNLGGGTSMQLIKAGAGTQILGGSNSYTGDTVINAGSLQINSSGAIGGNNVTVSGLLNSALVLNDALSAGSGKSLTIRGGGVGGFFGALTNVVGATGISEWQGSVIIGDATGARVGAQGGTLDISGSIGDSGAGRQLIVRNSNGGKTIFSGVNTYTGETLINASGGELQIEGGSAIHDAGLVNISNSAGNIFRVAGSETIGALTGGGANGKVALEASQVLTLSSGTQTFAGVVEGLGSLTINGSVQTLSNINTFTGDTTVTSGTLILGHASNTLADTSSVVVNGGSLSLGANSDTVGAVTLSSGSITASGSGTLTGASYDLRGGSVSARLAGTDVSLTKTTSGTVTLSAANTYTGATNVNAGKLVVSSTGSTAAGSSVTVSNSGSELVVDGTLGGALLINSGATLSGSGTIAGVTTIQGVHNPGNSPGIQTFNSSLNYDAGSSVTWELGANVTAQQTPAIFDQIIVGGNLNFNGATTVNLLFNGSGSSVDWSNSLWDTNQTWTIYSVTGNVNGLESATIANINWSDGSSALFNDVRSGAFFTLSLSGNDVLLNYTAVPETSVTLLGGLSAMLLLRRKRRAA